jgi:hypothetical protein
MSEDFFTVPRDAFLKMQMGPDGEDEMNFVLRSSDPDPEHFFSVEGVENITAQIRDFVLARAIAAHHRSGKVPKNVSVNVKLDWRGPSNAALELRGVPWYGADDHGPTPIDGDSRVRAARAAVERERKKG